VQRWHLRLRHQLQRSKKKKKKKKTIWKYLFFWFLGLFCNDCDAGYATAACTACPMRAGNQSDVAVVIIANHRANNSNYRANHPNYRANDPNDPNDPKYPNNPNNPHNPRLAAPPT
jgi:hypothetical protein